MDYRQQPGIFGNPQMFQLRTMTPQQRYQMWEVQRNMQWQRNGMFNTSLNRMYQGGVMFEVQQRQTGQFGHPNNPGIMGEPLGRSNSDGMNAIMMRNQPRGMHDLMRNHCSGMNNMTGNNPDGMNNIMTRNNPDGMNTIMPRNNPDGMNTIMTRKNPDGMNTIMTRNNPDAMNTIMTRNNPDAMNTIMTRNNSDGMNTIMPRNNPDSMNNVIRNFPDVMNTVMMRNNPNEVFNMTRNFAIGMYENGTRNGQDGMQGMRNNSDTVHGSMRGNYPGANGGIHDGMSRFNSGPGHDITRNPVGIGCIMTKNTDDVMTRNGSGGIVFMTRTNQDGMGINNPDANDIMRNCSVGMNSMTKNNPGGINDMTSNSVGLSDTRKKSGRRGSMTKNRVSRTRDTARNKSGPKRDNLKKTGASTNNDCTAATAKDDNDILQGEGHSLKESCYENTRQTESLQVPSTQSTIYASQYSDQQTNRLRTDQVPSGAWPRLVHQNLQQDRDVDMLAPERERYNVGQGADIHVPSVQRMHQSQRKHVQVSADHVQVQKVITCTQTFTRPRQLEQRQFARGSADMPETMTLQARQTLQNGYQSQEVMEFNQRWSVGILEGSCQNGNTGSHQNLPETPRTGKQDQNILVIEYEHGHPENSRGRKNSENFFQSLVPISRASEVKATSVCEENKAHQPAGNCSPVFQTPSSNGIWENGTIAAISQNSENPESLSVAKNREGMSWEQTVGQNSPVYQTPLPNDVWESSNDIPNPETRSAVLSITESKEKPNCDEPVASVSSVHQLPLLGQSDNIWGHSSAASRLQDHTTDAFDVSESSIKADDRLKPEGREPVNPPAENKDPSRRRLPMLKSRISASPLYEKDYPGSLMHTDGQVQKVAGMPSCNGHLNMKHLDKNDFVAAESNFDSGEVDSTEFNKHGVNSSDGHYKIDFQHWEFLKEQRTAPNDKSISSMKMDKPDYNFCSQGHSGSVLERKNPSDVCSQSLSKSVLTESTHSESEAASSQRSTHSGNEMSRMFVKERTETEGSVPTSNLFQVFLLSPQNKGFAPRDYGESTTDQTRTDHLGDNTEFDGPINLCISDIARSSLQSSTEQNDKILSERCLEVKSCTPDFQNCLRNKTGDHQDDQVKKCNTGMNQPLDNPSSLSASDQIPRDRIVAQTQQKLNSVLDTAPSSGKGGCDRLSESQHKDQEQLNGPLRNKLDVNVSQDSHKPGESCSNLMITVLTKSRTVSPSSKLANCQPSQTKTKSEGMCRVLSMPKTMRRVKSLDSISAFDIHVVENVGSSDQHPKEQCSEVPLSRKECGTDKQGWKADVSSLCQANPPQKETKVNQTRDRFLSSPKFNSSERMLKHASPLTGSTRREMDKRRPLFDSTLSKKGKTEPRTADENLHKSSAEVIKGKGTHCRVQGKNTVVASSHNRGCKVLFEDTQDILEMRENGEQAGEKKRVGRPLGSKNKGPFYFKKKKKSAENQKTEYDFENLQNIVKSMDSKRTSSRTVVRCLSRVKKVLEEQQKKHNCLSKSPHKDKTSSRDIRKSKGNKTLKSKKVEALNLKEQRFSRHETRGSMKTWPRDNARQERDRSKSVRHESSKFRDKHMRRGQSRSPRRRNLKKEDSKSSTKESSRNKMTSIFSKSKDLHGLKTPLAKRNSNKEKTKSVDSDKMKNKGDQTSGLLEDPALKERILKKGESRVNIKSMAQIKDILKRMKKKVYSRELTAGSSSLANKLAKSMELVKCPYKGKTSSSPTSKRKEHHSNKLNCTPEKRNHENFIAASMSTPKRKEKPLPCENVVVTTVGGSSKYRLTPLRKCIKKLSDRFTQYARKHQRETSDEKRKYDRPKAVDTSEPDVKQDQKKNLSPFKLPAAQKPKKTAGVSSHGTKEKVATSRKHGLSATESCPSGKRKMLEGRPLSVSSDIKLGTPDSVVAKSSKDFHVHAQDILQKLKVVYNKCLAKKTESANKKSKHYDDVQSGSNKVLHLTSSDTCDSPPKFEKACANKLTQRTGAEEPMTLCDKSQATLRSEGGSCEDSNTREHARSPETVALYDLDSADDLCDLHSDPNPGDHQGDLFKTSPSRGNKCEADAEVLEQLVLPTTLTVKRVNDVPNIGADKPVPNSIALEAGLEEGRNGNCYDYKSRNQEERKLSESAYEKASESTNGGVISRIKNNAKVTVEHQSPLKDSSDPGRCISLSSCCTDHNINHVKHSNGGNPCCRKEHARDCQKICNGVKHSDISGKSNVAKRRCCSDPDRKKTGCDEHCKRRRVCSKHSEQSSDNHVKCKCSSRKCQEKHKHLKISLHQSEKRRHDKHCNSRGKPQNEKNSGKQSNGTEKETGRLTFNIIQAEQLALSRLRLQTCPFCQKFSTRLASIMQEHMRELHPHRCVSCHQSFKDQMEVKVHRLTHHQQELHHCMMCQQIFTSKNRYNKHIESRMHKRLAEAQRDAFSAISRVLDNGEQKDEFAETLMKLQQHEKKLWAAKSRKSSPGTVLSNVSFQPPNLSHLKHFYYENQELKDLVDKFVLTMSSRMSVLEPGNNFGGHTDESFFFPVINIDDSQQWTVTESKTAISTKMSTVEPQDLLDLSLTEALASNMAGWCEQDHTYPIPYENQGSEGQNFRCESQSFTDSLMESPATTASLGSQEDQVFTNFTDLDSAGRITPSGSTLSDSPTSNVVYQQTPPYRTGSDVQLCQIPNSVMLNPNICQGQEANGQSVALKDSNDLIPLSFGQTVSENILSPVVVSGTNVATCSDTQVWKVPNCSTGIVEGRQNLSETFESGGTRSEGRMMSSTCEVPDKIQVPLSSELCCFKDKLSPLKMLLGPLKDNNKNHSLGSGGRENIRTNRPECRSAEVTFLNESRHLEAKEQTNIHGLNDLHQRRITSSERLDKGETSHSLADPGVDGRGTHDQHLLHEQLNTILQEIADEESRIKQV